MLLCWAFNILAGTVTYILPEQPSNSKPSKPRQGNNKCNSLATPNTLEGNCSRDVLLSTCCLCWVSIYTLIFRSPRRVVHLYKAGINIRIMSMYISRYIIFLRTVAARPLHNRAVCSPGGHQTLQTSDPTETFMERHADVRRCCAPTVKMAEAAVTPQHRFFCHCCKRETKPKLPVSHFRDPLESAVCRTSLFARRKFPAAPWRQTRFFFFKSPCRLTL